LCKKEVLTEEDLQASDVSQAPVMSMHV
jgi:hypothetical protein